MHYPSSATGFLIVPSCLLAVTLTLSTTLVQTALYGCSRGELQMLEVAAYDDLHFAKWQDHYVVYSDASYQRSFTMVTGDTYAKTLEIQMSDGPQYQGDEYEQDLSNSTAEVITVKIGEMSIPRVVNVSAQGNRQSQEGTNYSVLFSPQKKLPLFLRVSDRFGSFKRCVSWGALTDSELSIPPDYGNLNVSVVFADFALGPPYSPGHILPNASKVALDTTWTTFESGSSQNLEQCKKRRIGQKGSAGMQTSLSKAILGSSMIRIRHFLLCEVFSFGGHMPNKKAGLGDMFDTRMRVPNIPLGTADCDDLQVPRQAALVFEMFRASGSQPSSEAARVVLRRGAPVAMDVLVSLVGHSSSQQEEIPCNGSVTDEGNLVVQVSEYDPMTYKLLTLVIVPILADKHFIVQYGALPAGATDADDSNLPHFARCTESTLLQERYRPCNGPGQWETQPISLNISRWFPDLAPQFEIVPRTDAMAESNLWPLKAWHKVEVQFAGVDRPAAWSARDHGCELFSKNTNQEEWDRAMTQSADALCTLLAAGCMQHYTTRFCSIVEAALRGDMPEINPGIPPVAFLQAVACFKPFDQQKVCFGNVGPRNWQYDSVNLLFHGAMRGGRQSVSIPREILFSSLMSFDSKEEEPTYLNASFDVIVEMFLDTLDRNQLPRHNVIELFFGGALRTGCWGLIEKLMVKAKSSRSTNPFANFREKAKGAWEGLLLRRGSPRFNASQWLIKISETFGPEMLKNLVQVAVREGHYLSVPQAMTSFLKFSGKGLQELDIDLLTPLAVSDLGIILKWTPNLNTLFVKCWNCGPRQSSMSHQDGFFSALAKLPKLRRMELPAFTMSVPVFEHFVETLLRRDQLAERVPMRKLYLHAFKEEQPFEPRLIGAFAPICIIHLEARFVNGKTFSHFFRFGCCICNC